MALVRQHERCLWGRRWVCYHPLVARVTDQFGNPIAGASVAFAGPAPDVQSYASVASAQTAGDSDRAEKLFTEASFLRTEVNLMPLS